MTNHLSDRTIDHRAAAEAWIQAAEAFYDLAIQQAGEDQDRAVISALIGIGHALLAGPPHRGTTIHMEGGLAAPTRPSPTIEAW